MAKFRYSLQSVLNIKVKMESQKKQEFAAAMNALSEEEAKLAFLEEKKASHEVRAKELLQGKLDFQEIQENRQTILFLEERIVLQKERIKAAENVLEAARRALEEIIKERKTYENLREKAFEAYLQEENRAESKSIDELTSYTYNREH
ncbi:MAG: flagellar export protein FliJ [Lachnoclostridium sp.]|nr:flagellar export protein FliJ [Lachnospira sp.]MCM1246821.1 flagellar export protein FliJ [Lachnoclostridium sp.]MCM1535392.1 flagellar export protein FliJ [Clostridium sp.]